MQKKKCTLLNDWGVPCWLPDFWQISRLIRISEESGENRSRSACSSCSMQQGTWSGPDALCWSAPFNSFLTPCSLMVTSGMGGRLGPCKWMLADTSSSTVNTDLNWQARMKAFLRGSEWTWPHSFRREGVWLQKLPCAMTWYSTRTVYWVSLQGPQTGCCWCISSLISVGGDWCHDWASCMLFWRLCMVCSWLSASSTCYKGAVSCSISASILWWATTGHASSWTFSWVRACETLRRYVTWFGSTVHSPACWGTQQRSELLKGRWFFLDGGPLGFTLQMDFVVACFNILHSEIGVNHYRIEITHCRYT